MVLAGSEGHAAIVDAHALQSLAVDILDNHGERSEELCAEDSSVSRLAAAREAWQAKQRRRGQRRARRKAAARIQNRRNGCLLPLHSELYTHDLC